uniref:Uncharacterized protein n=1 Tax=Caenorhabditis tropicalis TaxID=1561998 RepID=A0A1I7T7W0_9PELO
MRKEKLSSVSTNENRIMQHKRSYIPPEVWIAAEKPLTQSYLNTTWSKHAKSHHNSDSLSLTLDIITTERNTTRRKALEATYIKDLDPKLNTKEEINELVNIFGTLQKT